MCRECGVVVMHQVGRNEQHISLLVALHRVASSHLGIASRPRVSSVRPKMRCSTVFATDAMWVCSTWLASIGRDFVRSSNQLHGWSSTITGMNIGTFSFKLRRDGMGWDTTRGEQIIKNSVMWHDMMWCQTAWHVASIPMWLTRRGLSMQLKMLLTCASCQ